MKKGRYVVQKHINFRHQKEITYNIYFEDNKDGMEYIGEFIYRSDAVRFKKLANADLANRGLYSQNLKIK